MALFSLGKVTVASAGTPVRLTTNQSTPATRYGAQSFTVQALAGNAGDCYIGGAGFDKSTLVGAYYILAKGTSVSFSILNAPVGYNMADVYVDAANSNDAVLVSGTIQ